MKLNSIRPMLWVDDVQATIAYYKNVLQFTHTHFVESVQWGYVIKDDVEIMFATISRLAPGTKMTFSGSLYLNTEDVNAWWELLKDKAEVFYPIEDFNYNMREFAIKDCNGYILQFGQEIK